MAIELKIPSVGESVTEVQVSEWLKSEGEPVQKDENVAVLETDKATVELPAPESGTLSQIVSRQGETVSVGTIIGYLEPGSPPSQAKKEPSQKKATAETAATGFGEAKAAGTKTGSPPTGSPPKSTEESPVMPAAQRLLDEHGLQAQDIRATGSGGRLLKEDVLRHLESQEQRSAESASATTTQPSEPVHEELEEVVPMSPLRRTVADRLVQAQQNAALLTTFNEVDMSAVMRLRKQYQETFQNRYGIKLGFMSFFIKASVDALKRIPAINAEIRDKNIVFRNYYDIGVAVSGGKGLVVPVIRRAEQLSFAEIERTIDDLATRARDNKIKLEELQGGTFTISNGGIFGSMLSTPIINPPQSGVLGMHTIQERPVAENGQVVIRPMMYVALTYDHRIVDGREAVTFLRRIKEAIEDPTRLLIEI